MQRLTFSDLEVIRHYLGSFRHFEGVGPLVDKIDAILEEGSSNYVKVVRLAFEQEGYRIDGEEEPPDGAWLNRLGELGCRVRLRKPPKYAIQVPDHGDAFDTTMDLLGELRRRRRLRYLT